VLSLDLLLTVLGVVLLILAALNVGSPRFSVGWAGLACLALTLLV